MFRRQTTRQIRQQVRAQEEARDEARRRSRATNRTARRSAKRAADQPNWVCIACQEVSDEDMGEVMECCRCKALGRYHWDCLAGLIQATADAQCPRCHKKFKDASGQRRIKRWKIYGPNILDYIFNYLWRTHPLFPGERDRAVLIGSTLIWIALCWLLHRFFAALTGFRGTTEAIFALLFFYGTWIDLVARYYRFSTKFPRDMVRLTQLADGEEQIMDATTKREQLTLENNLEVFANMQQMEQKMQQEQLNEAIQQKMQEQLAQQAKQQQGKQDLGAMFFNPNQ